MKPLIIKLKQAAKYYEMGESLVKALDCVDISIQEGDFVAIMGPSGSGKSTAMNLTGSLDLTTKGDIYLKGKNIENLEESELAQLRGKKIGFIFQQFNLIPNLTAKENVMLPMLFQNEDKEYREERAEKLLKSMELEDRMNHYPNQLSGGQQQRVAIARSLANKPDILLADEPTGNLDTKTGERVMGFLTDLNKKGRTIIIVTHDPEIAKTYAKTLYSLRDGKIESLEKKTNGKWKKVKLPECILKD
ncbi:MAG: ABC transporter ATP-binding protein [Nanoarchaeota archaeon]|nr:ABC transporter ATP-binding protein [Nanoarchaeota archaeon]MBU1028031.1 ABC transporter ATP-binding protein [Nanoarchaeota archaeon]